jgi:hypothetical protein
MAADSGSAPSGKRTKTTEIVDLPDAAVDDTSAGNVKGGSTAVPCLKVGVPCIKPSVPCIRNLPSR